MDDPQELLNRGDLGDEEKRLIYELHLSGPQDVYQLTPPERSPGDVETVLKTLIGKGLVEVRSDYLPAAPGDPFYIVYGLAKK